MAGVSVSAWRRPRVEWIAPEDPLVAADGAAHLGGGGGDAEDEHQRRRPPGREHAGERIGARRPGGPDGPEGEVAVVVAGAEGEADLEEVVRAAPGGWRRPTR